MTFTNGKRLKPGEKSKTGFYSIVKKTGSWTLRITLFQELAEIFSDENTRYIKECYITSVN